MEIERERPHQPPFIDSSYFHPDFNTAIFDGRLRLYFAHVNEAEALTLHFRVQNYLSAKKRRFSDRTVYVLLYPTERSFKECFSETKEDNALERFGEDIVVGLKGPFKEDRFQAIVDLLEAL